MPWTPAHGGLDGVLTCNWVVAFAFTSALGEHDFRRYGYAQGDPKGQQTWESLALLVALRLWAAEWQQRKFQINVKSDSMVALVMATKLKAAGVHTNRIARELAMDLGRGLYVPAIKEHTPGVANVLPDALSRLAAPCPPEFQIELKDIPLTQAPVRDRSYYYFV